ncbi:Pygopus-like protein 1 [Trichoplax sp. H2]|nr:Pygopus-like protein 1 [Trichoplax sp. H2]|eukprot:RDD45222.1 Pygopus-like protein 1 [Trichoplax sp. H2]
MPREGTRSQNQSTRNQSNKRSKKQNRKQDKLLESPPQQEPDEPSYPCGACGKEVNDNDDAILCESGCDVWFHRACTGLSQSAYGYLTSEENAEWICDNCYTSKAIPLTKCKIASPINSN